jgi:general secretion pathway protein I
LSPAPAASDRPDAGFTIIEVLVALAIVAVSVAVIGALMATNDRGVRSLEQHVSLAQAARTVMTAGLPARAELQPGTTSGQLEGYHWTVEVTSLGGNWKVPDAADVPWIPELVRVRVRAPSGATSDIRTVRLMPKASK